MEELMSELFKEMCSLSGKLNDLIDIIKDKDERLELLRIFFKVTDNCEKIAHEEFDENDDFYRDTVDNILETELLIKDFKENKLKLNDVLVYLIDIIADVDKIILGWKNSN
jgi:hypothetical protein